MIKRVILILTILIIGFIEPLNAQRRSPSKSADIAFERKQYNTAIERYKKAYKKTGKKKYQVSSFSSSQVTFSAPTDRGTWTWSLQL